MFFTPLNIIHLLWDEIRYNNMRVVLKAEEIRLIIEEIDSIVLLNKHLENGYPSIVDANCSRLEYLSEVLNLELKPNLRLLLS